MTNEEMAAIAEAVRASLSPDFKEIMNELKEIKTQIGQIEDRVINLERKFEESEVTTAFLAKDVYMLKNRAK